MNIPTALQPLIEDGIVDRVLRQLKSGKEATVYVVESGGELRCAKVYKDAEHRGFHKLAQYQEGRRARGSRDARALNRHSKRGRQIQESQWKTVEVRALQRLGDAGVRVPRPVGVYDGVLVMELLVGDDGRPAPRLAEVELDREHALRWHALMIRQIIRMLCAGLIHGDLSEYNVLIDSDGPVIIDLPQAVDAASNNGAFEMLARDVDNMRETFARAAPELLQTEYAREIWALYRSGALQADSALTGRYVDNDGAADVDAVLAQIEAARREAEARQRGREEAEAAERS
ncbi:MAG: serine protein kinase RIO [Nevskiales bacterium]|nr:serine protein kinase RIO [Nevskiales bacterium]